MLECLIEDCRQRVDFPAWIHETCAAVLDQVAGCADVVAGYDRTVAQHRFVHDYSECVVDGRKYHQIGARVNRRELRLICEAEKFYTLRDSESFRFGNEAWSERAFPGKN